MNIIITGATKGIGRAIAEAFAAAGYDVAACARRVEDLKAMDADFKERFPGVRLLTFQADVSKRKEVLAFVGVVAREWGSADVLVNNAGVFIPGATMEEADGALERMIETNLYSAYWTTRAVLPLMTPQKSGHIFNMCSIASVIAYPNGGSYSISKFALLGFTKVLREELKHQGIKVTAILPGATWSDSWAGVDLPESRLMQASDVASAVLSAASMSPAAVVEEIILRPQLGDL